MLRRRCKRLFSTSASILGLFVVVILLLLPTRAAALSRKQRILNWFAEASQGGGDQKANKAVEDEDLAVNSLTSIMKSSGEPLPGTIAPPPLLDQMLTLFASLGLPPDTLSHMSELTPEEIVHGLSTVMPTKTLHLRVGDEAVVDEATTLELTGVTDNRCPIGAQCITDGKANAMLTVRQEMIVPYKIEVGLGRAVLLQRGYEVSCEEITPRPGALVSSVLVSTSPSTELVEGSKTGAEQSEYRVRLRVALPTERMNGLVQGVLKWVKSNAMVRGYEFSQRRMCFCPQATIRPVRLDVSAWSQGVKGVYEDPPNGAVPPEALAEYKTVGDLFLLLTQAYALNADRVEASYDPVFGYPNRIYIDQSAGMADDDVMYEAYALKIK